MTKKLYIDFTMFKMAADKIIATINEGNTIYDSICALPQGGLILGTYLSYRLHIPLSNSIGEKTLIVDNVCSGGNTLSKYPHNDKVVLIAKTKGIINTENMLYIYEIPDDFVADFWWEEEQDYDKVDDNTKVKKNAKKSKK